MRELAGRRDELTRLIIGVRSLAQQISATIRGNKAQITPALTKLQSVLTVLEDQKTAISQAIPGLRNFSMSLGESVATGPFFTAFTANLVPVAGNRFSLQVLANGPNGGETPLTLTASGADGAGNVGTGQVVVSLRDPRSFGCAG